MPSPSELARLHPEIKSVCNYLDNQPLVQGDDYTLNQNGEMNYVLVGEKSIIKIPRAKENGVIGYESAALKFEAMIVAELDNTFETSPLILPGNLELDPHAYVMFSRVPGTTLTHEQARGLSPAEKEVYGRQLGLFIAWMAKVIRFEQYGEIIDLSNPKIENRERMIGLQATFQASQFWTDIPEPLGKILLDVRDEYRARREDGSLEPTIIGHDDLREDNLTFTRSQHLAGWVLSGVFDFGLTKPSSPERELRHLATLGQDALDSGIEAYENKTGARLSRDLIQFWALAQTATTYSAMLRSGDTSKTVRKHRDLQTLLQK